MNHRQITTKLKRVKKAAPTGAAKIRLNLPVQERLASATRYRGRFCHYQIRQASFRTIRSPALQPKALANSGMFEIGPLTRHLAAECGSPRTWVRSPSGVDLAAQTCAHPRKNRCSGVNPSISGGADLVF